MAAATIKYDIQVKTAVITNGQTNQIMKTATQFTKVNISIERRLKEIMENSVERVAVNMIEMGLA